MHLKILSATWRSFRLADFIFSLLELMIKQSRFETPWRHDCYALPVQNCLNDSLEALAFLSYLMEIRFRYETITNAHHRHPMTHSHYNDVIMSAMASQITSLTIVYSSIYSGADQRKHQSPASLAFVRGFFTGDRWFPAYRASNADNVSIRWRHHGKGGTSDALL